MALEGLAALVTRETVSGLLLGRAPEILQSDDQFYVDVFETAVRGATSEVVPLVGTSPAAGPRRDLAVRCIAYCAAAEIESTLFPEQQSPGDPGRAHFLIKRYNELRAQLQAMPLETPTDGASPVGPVGSFPPAQCYPDPARGW